MANNNHYISASLREFYGQLTAGNKALSLRDREAAAMADYAPLAENVKSGDQTSVDSFIEAAKLLLDIRREIHGSQIGYFDFLAEVQAITKTAMKLQSSVAAVSRTGDPGRPGMGYHLYELEHKRRLEAGEALPSVKSEANHLREWFIQSNSTLAPPTAKTIENRIRAAHRGPEYIVSGQFRG